MARDRIQAAVDTLAEHLHRSVVINDAAVHLQYASAHYGDEDAVRIRAVLQREADSKVIGHVLAQGVSTWTTAGVIPPNEALQMKARVCVPIRWRSDLVGLLIVMDADGSLTTGELATITGVARDLAPLLAAQPVEDPPVEHGLIVDLVGREPLLRRRALAELAGIAGFASVRAVELSAQGAADATVAANIDTALRSALGGVRPPAGSGGLLHAVTDRVAIALVGSAAPLADGVVRTYVERVLHRVHDLSAGRFTCSAGIGDGVAGLEHAHRSAGQAALAGRAAATVLDRPVATWAELGPYGLLLRVPDLDASALPAELHRLLSVDPERQLVRTLRVYLDHGCNGPAASAALHIHRTTLYYRLGRIRELTGLDLDDGRTRLTLHLGLTALDLLPP